MISVVGRRGRPSVPLAKGGPIASGGSLTFPIPPLMCGVGGSMGGVGWVIVLFTPLCEMARATRYGFVIEFFQKQLVAPIASYTLWMGK